MSECECLGRTLYRSLTPKSKASDASALFIRDISSAPTPLTRKGHDRYTLSCLYFRSAPLYGESLLRLADADRSTSPQCSVIFVPADCLSDFTTHRRNLTDACLFQRGQISALQSYHRHIGSAVCIKRRPLAKFTIKPTIVNFVQSPRA